MDTPRRGAFSVFALFALLIVASDFFESVSSNDAECDLEKAFHVILSQSSELNSDHLSHLKSLEEREKLTRAVQLALDSMKTISQSVNFTAARYRRIDGLGNNLNNPFWGASLHTERRLLNNSYDDGCDIPRYKSVTGKILPSSREASVKCFLPDKEESPFLDPFISQMFMQFGQFLDHDIILTELEIGSNCCNEMNADGTHPDMFNSNPCFPIQVPDGDRHFDTCITARRSLGVKVNGVREQVNGVTSYVDASQVYGPAKKLSDELRTFTKGHLKVTNLNGLPQFGVFKCLKDAIPACPHAGDPRVGVFPGLTLMHTLFHREHNRIADKLAQVNPHWNDERLFQEARKIVIAINQKITYEEYVPKVIGPDMMGILGINDTYEYHPDIDASVTNVFGAAAFRFGHSQINGPLKIDGDTSPAISEIFFKPEIIIGHDDAIMKNIIINQARLRAQKSDHFFSTQVLDLLFKDVDAPGESFDLPALAVHRCRDHGLPGYLEYVDLCVKAVSHRNSHTMHVKELNLPTCFIEGVYESTRDIDLFVGAMYETPVTGGLVGPTFAYLVGEQFYRLKFGDRFWYETSDEKIGFTPAQLKEIQEKTSLAHVFCNNNNKLKFMHPRAMETRRYQQKKSCSLYEDIDFSHWAEAP